MKKLKKRLVLAVYVVLLSTGWACANSVYLPSVLASDGNGSHDKGAPVADTRVVQDGDRGVVHEEQNPHVDSTAPVEACLKEGRPVTRSTIVAARATIVSVGLCRHVFVSLS